MAEVWRADAVFESGETYAVAIKRVLPQLAADPVHRQMFQDEARLGMLLRHPNIARVYDYRELQGGTLMMVMELVDGISLKAIFDDSRKTQLTLSTPLAIYIVREIARGLAYAHAAVDADSRPLNIVHRDVSPHNVLLGQDGVVKLADFGLANADLGDVRTGEGRMGGKFAYLSPEVLDGSASTPRADVFALGIVLWEILAGRSLFLGPTQKDTVHNVYTCNVPRLDLFRSGLPAELEAIIRAMLERDPKRRMSGSAQAVLDLSYLLDRTEPKVDARDVSMAVGIHRTAVARFQRETSRESLAPLMEELREFAEVAEGSVAEIGARELDPNEFGWLPG